MTGARAIALSVAAAIYLVLVGFSGLDRYTPSAHAQAARVPPSLRDTGNVVLAADAIGRDDFRAAAMAARGIVDASPLDSRGVGYLAAAQMGLELPSGRSWAVAAQLNSRDVLARVQTMEDALRRGDAATAADHLDVVLRTKPDLPDGAYFAAFEASARGRAALAGRLRTSEVWRRAYLDPAAPDLRRRARFLTSDDPVLAPLGCARVAGTIAALGATSQRRLADAVAAQHCTGSLTRGGLADGDFSQFGSQQEQAIGWSRIRSGDVQVIAIGDGSETRLEMESRASVTRPVLSQPVALAAGTYRLRGKVAGPGGERIAASLACDMGARPHASRERIDRGGLALSTPACENAMLVLWLRPGRGRVVLGGLTLDQVSPAINRE